MPLGLATMGLGIRNISLHEEQWTFWSPEPQNDLQNFEDPPFLDLTSKQRLKMKKLGSCLVEIKIKI